MVVSVKNAAYPRSVDKEKSIQDSKRESISPSVEPSEKQRSVLVEPKYGPGSEPHWKAGSARYP